VLVVAKAAGAQAVAAAVRNTSGVAQVLPPEQAGGWALITGVLTDRADTQAAEQTVDSSSSPWSS
jgi:RND superfamily putative drug exporter